MSCDAYRTPVGSALLTLAEKPRYAETEAALSIDVHIMLHPRVAEVLSLLAKRKAPPSDLLQPSSGSLKRPRDSVPAALSIEEVREVAALRLDRAEKRLCLQGVRHSY